MSGELVSPSHEHRPLVEKLLEEAAQLLRLAFRCNGQLRAEYESGSYAYFRSARLAASVGKFNAHTHWMDWHEWKALIYDAMAPRAERAA